MACSIHNGLAIHRFGEGEPIFLMPGPHRFARPSLPMTDSLIDGLARLHREVIIFDPPGSGRSTRRSHLGIPFEEEPARFWSAVDHFLTLSAASARPDQLVVNNGGARSHD
jgi:hypothetical protein